MGNFLRYELYSICGIMEMQIRKKTLFLVLMYMFADLHRHIMELSQPIYVQRESLLM